MDYRTATRRELLKLAAGMAGLPFLLPMSVACVNSASKVPPTPSSDPLALPTVLPAGWDPVAFNRARGSAGAIPEAYRAKIDGPDGVNQHLGKHLPYLPQLPQGTTPSGMLAIMWGDASRGYSRHPNAPVSGEFPTGHWYNWIRLRRAVEGDAEERESRFTSWPSSLAGDTGAFGAYAGSDLAADGGRNTVYFASLPADVGPGDRVRVHGHCLTHGEYVDFVRLTV